MRFIAQNSGSNVTYGQLAEAAWILFKSVEGAGSVAVQVRRQAQGQQRLVSG
jgi:hypothetical protein